MTAEKSNDVIDRIWLGFSSLRMTGLLATVLALFSAVAIFIPQGPEAMDAAEGSGATWVHAFAAWGLTEIFTSNWMLAVGTILAANVIAVVIRLAVVGPRKEAELLQPPQKAPCKANLVASLPERAVEALRESFRSALGNAPLAEQVDGSRVTMVFDTSPGSRFTPLLVHLGIVLLVVGAGFSVRPPPASKSAVRALLDVKDSRTKFVGQFDIMEGEAFEFFRWKAKYTIRNYLPDKDGLGPAVRFDITQNRNPVGDFWIYQNAPAGFDERHRKGSVSITARKLSPVALPGEGFASSPAAVLMILGMGLLGVGAFASRRPHGRLWLQTDGDQVELTGVPQHAGDEGFKAGFRRFEHLARAALES